MKTLISYVKLFLNYCRTLLVFLHILSPKDKVQEAEVFAFWKHMSVGQFYAGWFPYYYHLYLVVKAGKKFMPEHYTSEQRIVLLIALWLHDTIEDARMTYNDIKTRFGYRVAEIVYAMSNEKGKNRKERASDKYYEGIREVEGAPLAKLCDRYANVLFSKMRGSRMFGVYKIENPNFMEKLSPLPDECVDIANAIEVMFGNQPKWKKSTQN